MMIRIKEKEAYVNDHVGVQVMAQCEHGWSPIITDNPVMCKFYQVCDKLIGFLLLLGLQIVMPPLLLAKRS